MNKYIHLYSLKKEQHRRKNEQWLLFMTKTENS